MNNDEFWGIIEQSRGGILPGIMDEEATERQQEKLATLLEALSPESVVSFDAAMREMHRQSNHWDLWGVAYIIGGGCSDDAFEYFRRWLLAQGRETFERTVRDPESLVAIIPAGDENILDAEGFFYVAGDVYEAKTGKDLMDLVPTPEPGASEPRGDIWTEDDLPERFPKTWAKFGWNSEDTGDET